MRSPCEERSWAEMNADTCHESTQRRATQAWPGNNPPTSEKWLDKAVSTISRRLIEPWEWLMKSNNTAADKIRP